MKKTDNKEKKKFSKILAFVCVIILSFVILMLTIIYSVQPMLTSAKGIDVVDVPLAYIEEGNNDNYSDACDFSLWQLKEVWSCTAQYYEYISNTAWFSMRDEWGMLNGLIIGYSYSLDVYAGNVISVRNVDGQWFEISATDVFDFPLYIRVLDCTDNTIVGNVSYNGRLVNWLLENCISPAYQLDSDGIYTMPDYMINPIGKMFRFDSEINFNLLNPSHIESSTSITDLNFIWDFQFTCPVNNYLYYSFKYYPNTYYFFQGGEINYRIAIQYFSDTSYQVPHLVYENVNTSFGNGWVIPYNVITPKEEPIGADFYWFLLNYGEYLGVASNDDLHYYQGYYDGYSYGYNVGVNQKFSEDLIEDFLMSPQNALDSVILFRSNTFGLISLFDLLVAFIGLSLFIWFLKVFVGG